MEDEHATEADIQLKPPSLKRRAAAFGIDIFIASYITSMVAGLIISRMSFETFDPEFGFGDVLAAGIVILGTQFVVSIIFFGIIPIRSGKTLGKNWMRIKIVVRDGSHASAFRIVFRSIIQNIWSVFALAFVVGFYAVRGFPIEYTLPGLGILVINPLVAFFDQKEQRSLHDRFAGTRVIRDI